MSFIFVNLRSLANLLPKTPFGGGGGVENDGARVFLLAFRSGVRFANRLRKGGDAEWVSVGCHHRSGSNVPFASAGIGSGGHKKGVNAALHSSVIGYRQTP